MENSVKLVGGKNTTVRSLSESNAVVNYKCYKLKLEIIEGKKFSLLVVDNAIGSSYSKEVKAKNIVRAINNTINFLKY